MPADCTYHPYAGLHSLGDGWKRCNGGDRSRCKYTVQGKLDENESRRTKSGIRAKKEDDNK